MRYRLRYYRTQTGRCPVQDFLEEIRCDRPELFRILYAGIRRLRDGNTHRRPLVGDLRPSELHEVRKDDGRILFAYRKNQLIVLLLGLVKKKSKMAPRDIELAEGYLRDYLERCGDDDDGSDEELFG